MRYRLSSLLTKSKTNKPGFALSGLILCCLLISALCISGCGDSVSAGEGGDEDIQIKVIETPDSNDNKEDTGEDTVNTGADDKDGTGSEDTDNDSAGGESSANEPAQLVWATYWDTEGLREALADKADTYDSIGYFAAYYNEEGRAFVPDGTLNLVNDLKASGLFAEKKAYLTFVNDQVTASGSKLKDSQLVYSLIGDSDLAGAHVEEIMTLVKDGGYNGVEIDYEAIKGDMTLWSAFLDFIKMLNTRTSEEGLALRVLFEPGAPIDAFDWPKGPEYVMMCYNLYGFGTEPGPKANPEFLNEMVDKMEPLGDNINFALANGGFDWAEDGSISQIQNPQIDELIEKYGLTPARDGSSFDMIITYTDDFGMKHTIWYADEQTIEAWKQVIIGRGHNRFSLWRFPI